MNDTPESVIEYWASLSEKEWFSEGKNPELDRQITEKFLVLHNRAAAGDLIDWEKTPAGRFALIILFDQMSRHIYRHDATLHYHFDQRAREISRVSLAQWEDSKFPGVLGRFFFFPFLHSESMEDLMVAKEFGTVRNYSGILSAIDRKVQILNRFGRYPWRNAFHKRYCTQEELDWFKTENGNHLLQIEMVRHKLEEWCLAPEHEKETK
jgi:uncharacterized protein (DUF924 family)